jgi:hypothetical protein
MESEGPFPRLKAPATCPYLHPDQSSPCLPSHSIVTLYSHPRPGLPSGLFPSGLSNKSRYAPLLSHIPATCTALLIPLDLITRIILGEVYQSLNSSLCSFLHYSVTLSLLGQTILFSNLFPNTLSLCSSLIVSAHVSRPYKTTGEIIVLYI